MARNDAGNPSVRPESNAATATMENEASMSNTDTQAATQTGGHEFDGFLGKSFEEKPIWTGLYESIRDVFFPVKLPPLELTSTPIPVPDRMAVKPNPWAIGIATFVNLSLLGILIFLGVKSIINAVNKPKENVTKVDVPTEFTAPKRAVAAGGGGGSPDKMDASKGRVPPRTQPILMTPKIEAPVPTIDVQKDIVIPDDPTLPNFGMSKSPNVKLGSLGNGSGMGVGNGHGNGYGDGTGGNIGGGLYRVGGGVSAPEPLNQVEAEFSDEARRAKYQGVCLISLIVDAQGNPQNPRVVRALGMGLDEKALEAVKKYKFRPAMKQGLGPVPVMITVEVNFRLY
jgi:protein TonB